MDVDFSIYKYSHDPFLLQNSEFSIHLFIPLAGYWVLTHSYWWSMYIHKVQTNKLWVILEIPGVIFTQVTYLDRSEWTLTRGTVNKTNKYDSRVMETKISV